MRVILLLALIAHSVPAAAAEADEFCVDRPGLDTPTCTIGKGRAAFELGVADWSLEREDGRRDDAFAFGQLLLRYGIGERLEIQAGWDGFGILRQGGHGGTMHESGGGDVRVALRYALGEQDGLSAAIMPFATFPVGSAPLGGDGWSAGLVLPVAYALPNGLEVDFTGEVDAAADGPGAGHHPAYSGTVGLAVPLTAQLSSAVEVQASRDEQPGGTDEQLLGGLSFAWNPAASLQLDAGANFGLGHHDPDLELYAGFARRF